MVLTDQKVVLGMSGGVDSSVSLYLLKRTGFDVTGVSLKYDVWKNCKRENVCCSQESFDNAARVCKHFGVRHEIIDVSREFNDKVIGYYKSELGKDRTPSPCVFCNPQVKFKELAKFADKIDAQYIATGHYARLRRAKTKGQSAENKAKFELLKAKDTAKDQTYSLCFLTQKELSRTIFPLGSFTKDEVYQIAMGMKELSFYQKVKQSQDFCFLGKKDQKKFIEEEIRPEKGEIVNEKGEVLGHHDGLSFYTIGQRKSIGLAGGPYFVLSKDAKTNRLVVSSDEKLVYAKEVWLNPINIISDLSLDAPLKVSSKPRSSAELSPATISPRNGGLTLKFQKPQFALTPGQVAVFYLKDVCIGGGVIS